MNTCPKCLEPSPEHCWNALERVTTGWWCTKCNHFERAIGRERQLVPSEITYGGAPQAVYSEPVPTNGERP